MTPLQAAAIISLTAAGAWRILFFDTRGRTHKPLICFIAWLKFAWMIGLMIAVIFKLYSAAVWGLIFGLALHTGALILARRQRQQHPADRDQTSDQPLRKPHK